MKSVHTTRSPGGCWDKDLAHMTDRLWAEGVSLVRGLEEEVLFWSRCVVEAVTVVVRIREPRCVINRDVKLLTNHKSFFFFCFHPEFKLSAQGNLWTLVGLPLSHPNHKHVFSTPRQFD